MNNLSRTRNVFSRIYIDYNPGYKHSIFLAGSGRSGTTWLGNIINYRNEYRYIFEPFHPERLNIYRNFKNRQYHRPENRDKKYIKPMEAILTGKIRGTKIDQHNKKLICNKRLIKAIRANLLLKWSYVNFPGLKIIFLLRHPCAVANSQINLNWDVDLEQFLIQEKLMDDYLNPFRHEILKAKSNFEKQIFRWCIENYVPLEQFKKGELCLIFYENLCEKPYDEIDKLFSFLNKKYNKTIFTKMKNPSTMTRKNSAIISGGSLINDWRKKITPQQIKNALDILSLFGLDEIYTEDSIPNIKYSLRN